MSRLDSVRVPWKQFTDLLRGMIGKCREALDEPGLWINILEFARLNHRDGAQAEKAAVFFRRGLASGQITIRKGEG
jgi:hypothetical protein